MRRSPLLRGALLGAADVGHRAGNSRAHETAQEQLQNEQIEELQEAASADSLIESDEPAGTDDDAIAKLTQLATLRRQDLINDDEYAAAKAKLLGI